MATPSLSLTGRDIKHKTLSAYYHRVCTIPAFFGTEQLIEPADPREYVDFITGTLCAVRDRSSPTVPLIQSYRSKTVTEKRSQQECVDWVMRDLAGRGKNVLVKSERVSRRQCRIVADISMVK